MESERQISIMDKSFREIITDIEPDSVSSSLQLIENQNILDKMPTSAQIEEITKCSTSVSKLFKIIQICNTKTEMEKIANDTALVANTMNKIQEENKMGKWDFRKFEPQEDEIFVSGEFKIWVRDLNDYCNGEKFSEEQKLKGFVNKSGKFLQKLISTIKTTKQTAFDKFESAVLAITDELTPPGGKGLIDFTFRSCEPKPNETNSEFLIRLVRWSTYVDFASEDERATAILNTAMQKVGNENLKSDIYKYGFMEKTGDRMNAVKQIINLAKISDCKKSVVKKLKKRSAEIISDDPNDNESNDSNDSNDEENSAKVMNVSKKPRMSSQDGKRENHGSKVESLLQSLLTQMQKTQNQPGPSRRFVKPECEHCQKSHFGRCWSTIECHACGKKGHMERNCPGKYRKRERSRSPPRRYNSKFDRSRKRVMKTEKNEKTEKVKEESDSDSDLDLNGQSEK